MLLNILLVVISVLALFFLTKKTRQLTELKKRLIEAENRLQQKQQPDEFLLGLTNINAESPGKILLDPLTGLPGRGAFDDRLLQTLNQSKRFERSFAIVLLDISEFHILNEAQSHEIGDKILREVAKRLQGVIRQIDTMTRYAGNTFVFLLPQLWMPETAAYVAQRLLDNIVLPFEIDNQHIFITASVGVAIYPTDGIDTKTLLKNADDALHQAKLHGKGKYKFYSEDLHALSERELTLSSVLRSPSALQKLFIYYYPYINVKTGAIVCIQATPYLKLPETGEISFSDFSKIAENAGRIIDIGEWLLRNTILQYQKWHQEGVKPETVAIKVTLRQVEDSHFIYKVSQILQELSINPRQVIFELAEENLFTNTSTLEKSFSMLNHLGIQISLSVFALGHFALQKITKLPINYLKLDAKLIEGKNTHKESETILHMIVSLAKDMKITIIAEGVENENQKNILQELGCEVMQGKLFGEPLPVESMVKI